MTNKNFTSVEDVRDFVTKNPEAIKVSYANDGKCKKVAVSKSFMDRYENNLGRTIDPKSLFHIKGKKDVETSVILTLDAETTWALLASQVCNRRPTEAFMTYLADMINNNWRNTGETVSISKDGHLIDGGHRLLANLIYCLLNPTRIPSWKFCIYIGSDADAFGFIDKGKGRTFSQTFDSLIATDDPRVAPIKPTLIKAGISDKKLTAVARVYNKLANPNMSTHVISAHSSTRKEGICSSEDTIINMLANGISYFKEVFSDPDNAYLFGRADNKHRAYPTNCTTNDCLGILVYMFEVICKKNPGKTVDNEMKKAKEFFSLIFSRDQNEVDRNPVIHQLLTSRNLTANRPSGDSWGEVLRAWKAFYNGKTSYVPIDLNSPMDKDKDCFTDTCWEVA